MILQVPVSKKIKLSAQEAAGEMGFNSLQDAVRLFLGQLSKRSLSINFIQQFPDEVLTSAQSKVLTRKYNQAAREMRAGKGITTSSVDEMMKFLRS